MSTLIIAAAIVVLALCFIVPAAYAWRVLWVAAHE